MGRITLNNIRVYAYHGCLPEETKIGSNYRVDVTVDCDLTISAKTDNLNDTVDYVLLNRIVKEEMAITSKLLETVANRILKRILKDKRIKKAKVTVCKLNPPIGGDVEAVCITMRKKRKN